MKTTITYANAQALLAKYIKGTAMRNHSQGTAIAMRAIACSLGQDEEHWDIVGLLHDLDMEVIGTDLSQHGVRTVEILRKEGYDIPDLFTPVIAHTEVLACSPYRRETTLDYILSGVENLVGLIAAYVAMRQPTRTIIGAEAKSVVKKMKDKSFANNVNREAISDAIERSGMERADFIQVVIDALSEHAKEIGM